MQIKDREHLGPTGYILSLFHNLQALILCNVLFLLFCIPVFTAGAALIALNRVVCKLIEEESVSVIHEFWQTMKREFLSGLLTNVLILPVAVATGMFSLRCLRLLLLKAVSLPLAAAIFLVFFLCCSFCVYWFPLLAFSDASLGTVLKNTVLLCGANGVYTALGGITTGILLLTGFGLFPYSFPVLVCVWFAVVAFNACFFGWQGAKRFVFPPYYTTNPEKTQKIWLE